MWLSKELARARAAGAAEAESGTVTVSGGSVGVFGSGEVRGAAVAAPGGYVWRPGGGERVVLLKGGAPEGGAFLLGVLGQEESGLAPGEVCLHSEGAKLVLRADGRIELTGRLFVNGREIGGADDGA